MSDWYTSPGTLARLITARAEDINTREQSVADAFAGLPTKNAVLGAAVGYAIDGGSANAYAVTLSPAPTAYVAGMTIRFLAANTNTGPSTLNVNGLGVRAIVSASGDALGSSAIIAGMIVTATYNGTNFRLSTVNVAQVSDYPVAPTIAAAL